MPIWQKLLKMGPKIIWSINWILKIFSEIFIFELITIWFHEFPIMKHFFLSDRVLFVYSLRLFFVEDEFKKSWKFWIGKLGNHAQWFIKELSITCRLQTKFEQKLIKSGPFLRTCTKVRGGFEAATCNHVLFAQ